MYTAAQILSTTTHDQLLTAQIIFFLSFLAIIFTFLITILSQTSTWKGVYSKIRDKVRTKVQIQSNIDQ